MSKTIRILTAILASLAIGGMFAYQDAQKNEPTYQQHPVTVVLTDFFCGFLSGLFFYFGSGWLERRRERKLQKVGNDKFYDEVARELQEKTLVAGLWTKAYAEMGGDDAKARALYIKCRVEQLAEASRQQRPEEQKYSRSTQVVFVAAIIVAVVLAAILGVMMSNKNVKVNANPVTPIEQISAIQTPAESNFDKQKNSQLTHCFKG